MTQTGTGADRDVHQEARQVIDDMRTAVASGQEHWFTALLEAVREWPLPFEDVDGRPYHYLVGGEAFDWLLLAERLAMEISDFVAEDEIEALLFHEKPPVETSEEDFRQKLGAKYKLHLNFVYGVRVEAALQLAVGEEVRKEDCATRVWAKNGYADDEVYRRIYGKPVAELHAEYRRVLGIPSGEWMSLSELSEWRYWLFQYRVKNCDPAKVASDTRKGVALLQHLEMLGRRRSQDAAEDR